MDTAEKEYEKKLIEEQRNLYTTFSRVFSSEDGVKVLTNLIKKYGVLETTFDSDSSNLAFNEGRRSVVLDILKILNTDIENEYKNVLAMFEKANRDRGVIW